MDLKWVVPNKVKALLVFVDNLINCDFGQVSNMELLIIYQSKRFDIKTLESLNVSAKTAKIFKYNTIIGGS
jgi:hypothetical protein